jgi:hypothetical protein
VYGRYVPPFGLLRRLKSDPLPPFLLGHETFGPRPSNDMAGNEWDERRCSQLSSLLNHPIHPIPLQQGLSDRDRRTAGRGTFLYFQDTAAQLSTIEPDDSDKIATPLVVS